MRNDTDPDQPSDRYGFHRDALRDASRDAPDGKRDDKAGDTRRGASASTGAPASSAPQAPHLRVVDNEPANEPANDAPDVKNAHDHPLEPQAPAAHDLSDDDGRNGRGLVRLKELSPDFDETRFVEGAQRAYEMILQAFASGDRATLEDLLTPPVYDGFAAAIDARERADQNLATEILRMSRPVIDDVVIRDGLVQITVQFIADIRTRVNEDEGDATKTEDLWTFERSLDADSPNWLLSATQTVS